MSKFKNLPIIDCHVHFDTWACRTTELTNEEFRKMSEFIVRVIMEGRLSKMYISGGDAGLYLKAKYPEMFYAGAYIPWSGETDKMPNVNWQKYIQLLFEVGFDGIGEVGSKPVPKNKHIPLNSDYYRGFWETCEAYGFPVLCHVADPEEFWDKNLAPEWAVKRGWIYVEDYPSKKELYKEMENVLEIHPDLKVVLCHFYFISADLEKASDFLERYKNANFDLAPGIELIYNISRRRDEWREFFIKYQDRILFGTDIATWQTIKEAMARIWLVRKFLESDEEFFTPEIADDLLTRYKEPFIGLNLPEGVLRKIYAKNFMKLWGEKPKKTNIEIAIKICEEKGEKIIAENLKNLSYI